MLPTNNVIDMQEYRMRKLFREHPVISIQQATHIKASRFYNSYASAEKRAEVAEQWAAEDTDNTPTKVNPNSRFGKLMQQAYEWSAELDEFNDKAEATRQRLLDSIKKHS